MALIKTCSINLVSKHCCIFVCGLTSVERPSFNARQVIFVELWGWTRLISTIIMSRKNMILNVNWRWHCLMSVKSTTKNGRITALLPYNKRSATVHNKGGICQKRFHSSGWPRESFCSKIQPVPVHLLFLYIFWTSIWHILWALLWFFSRSHQSSQTIVVHKGPLCYTVLNQMLWCFSVFVTGENWPTTITAPTYSRRGFTMSIKHW